MFGNGGAGRRRRGFADVIASGTAGTAAAGTAATADVERRHCGAFKILDSAQMS